MADVLYTEVEYARKQISDFKKTTEHVKSWSNRDEKTKTKEVVEKKERSPLKELLEEQESLKKTNLFYIDLCLAEIDKLHGEISSALQSTDVSQTSADYQSVEKRYRAPCKKI